MKKLQRYHGAKAEMFSPFTENPRKLLASNWEVL
jgi:hypothetical protein